MKPEAQRIVIAAACGWLDKRIPTLTSDTSLGRCWISPIGRFHQTCPDYLNDLNAMHEAEKTLSGTELWPIYEDFLLAVTARKGNHLVRATAAQRAEAFLRAIGKWVES